MSPIRILYDHPFLINLTCPQGITLNPCPEGFGGGGSILKDIIYGSFKYVEQNGNVKILIGCIWGKSGRGKGVSHINHF